MTAEKSSVQFPNYC